MWDSVGQLVVGGFTQGVKTAWPCLSYKSVGHGLFLVDLQLVQECCCNFIVQALSAA